MISLASRSCLISPHLFEADLIKASSSKGQPWHWASHAFSLRTDIAWAPRSFATEWCQELLACSFGCCIKFDSQPRRKSHLPHPFPRMEGKSLPRVRIKTPAKDGGDIGPQGSPGMVRKGSVGMLRFSPPFQHRFQHGFQHRFQHGLQHSS